MQPILRIFKCFERLLQTAKQLQKYHYIPTPDEVQWTHIYLPLYGNLSLFGEKTIHEYRFDGITKDSQSGKYSLLVHHEYQLNNITHEEDYSLKEGEQLNRLIQVIEITPPNQPKKWLGWIEAKVNVMQHPFFVN